MKSQLASKRHNGEALKARVRGCATSYPYQQKENGQLRYPSLSQHLYVKELSTTIINIRNIIYYYIYIYYNCEDKSAGNTRHAGFTSCVAQVGSRPGFPSRNAAAVNSLRHIWKPPPTGNCCFHNNIYIYRSVWTQPFSMCVCAPSGSMSFFLQRFCNAGLSSNFRPWCDGTLPRGRSVQLNLVNWMAK